MGNAAKITFGCVLLALTNGAMADTVLVPVTANVYGSGHFGANATPSPSGGGGGTAPPSIDVFATTQFEFFAYGNAKFSPSNPISTTPDGPVGSATTFSGHNGLSGFSSDHDYALYGVFVGPVEPADPRPIALNFVGNTSFASLSPQLDQVFYIGDGLTGTGSGTTQVFNVPVGALKLYFGLADGIGNPIVNGFYGDNTGDGYQVDVTRAVPEPTASAFLLFGALAILSRSMRSRRHVPTSRRPRALTD